MLTLFWDCPATAIASLETSAYTPRRVSAGSPSSFLDTYVLI